MSNFYLQKYAYCQEQIKARPCEGLGIIVVIPCFNEPDLISTLKSIHACDKPKCAVEVIVVINAPENADENVRLQNSSTYDEAIAFSKEVKSNHFLFHILNVELPIRDAGVGLARKVGMDEAVSRFEKIRNHEGLIVCLDADSLVDNHYLTEIEKHFEINKKSVAASIYFEHPLEGKLESKVYEGIVLYELFLRYYVNALRYAGHPYAFETIGSSMVVRSNAYQAQGGMNKRKAGEDFYFLQKMIALGKYTEINATRVIPSPRISNRVPFGTGRAIGDFTNGKEILFYDFRIFTALKKFIESVSDLYRIQKMETYLSTLPECVLNFLKKNEFEKVLEEIKTNTSNQENFEKRFFNWFNGFLVLKYVHYATEHFYNRVSALEATHDLMLVINKNEKIKSEKEALLYWRDSDKNS